MEPLAGMLFGVVTRPAAVGMITARPDCSRSYRPKQGKRGAALLIGLCPSRHGL